ncbi:MBL fold metallo-hydrolase [Bacillus thuringiensis]|uniref:MBL fold metallo-hydrolase n=1 Tax=Bacillus thuringiensis TaxID=1428 RepID=UPI000BF7711B|nr:MBL fold metallo-hydrolase [Bacillus thuringiensis]PEW73455.1 MBL fold metallo-hydrolase [Bacillus thuringiensis]PFA31034.1 MBL fold metallo-hydrolase [Bacillus thuringiensis]PFD29013.1 MBL fold metallo-hydrolase [Bacillus thuringiensis]PFV75290.1 MBL fold metallo-hydrolase [Bacillus thuringiensis]PGL20050.1 MBL fold metallo-hydrolase [Bacillus thuringiensis]
MNEMQAKKSTLNWKVLVSKRNSATRDLPAGNESLMWVANTVTLIYGEQDAVLVDTFLTIEQNQNLIDWIAESGKNLTTIYITHGHGDHFFGIKMILDRFPQAKAIATPDAVKAMREQIAPEYVESFWNKLFPGQVPTSLITAEEIEEDEFYLEGNKLVVVNTGYTDTSNTTALHVPSINLVVGGDAVYNDIHLYMAETNKQTRLEWITVLDKLEALNPLTVVAGHKKPENDDNPKIITETRNYIQDFNKLEEITASSQELYAKMLELYPNRANPGSLWGSVKAAKAK